MTENDQKPNAAEVNSILKNTRNSLLVIATLFLLTNLDPTISSKEPLVFLKDFIPPLSIILAIITHFASKHPPIQKCE